MTLQYATALTVRPSTLSTRHRRFAIVNYFAEDPTALLGMIAATFTTFAYLPQLLKIWKSKSAGDMSWMMLIVLCAGVALWLAYGVAIDDKPVIVANTLTLLFVGMMSTLKLVYRPRVAR